MNVFDVRYSDVEPNDYPPRRNVYIARAITIIVTGMDGKQYFVGIDLGMINSVMAFTDKDGVVSIQRWDRGHTKFPSVVLLTPNRSYAGQLAIDRKFYEDRYHFENYFKRMMGTTHKQRIYNTDYTPTELFAMILHKMIRTFENEHEQKVERAVLAVPADFGDAEREAIIKAAYLAGIKDPRIINESNAAAISYCHDIDDFVGKAAIYDIGGGTFDVTVMDIRKDGFDVLSNEGSKFLGGRDWDLQLASIIQKKIISGAGLKPKDIDNDSELRRRILSEAERHKIILDRVDKSKGAVLVRGKYIGFEITREELDNATIELVSKTVKMTSDAVRAAGLTYNTLNRIVMVGGPSITPLIRTMLENDFPNVEITRYDPIHAVARGASIYARSVFSTNDIRIRSVLNKSFGLKMGVDGEEVICNLLHRNVTLPISKEVLCRPKSDDQEILDISVYENRSVKGDMTTPVTRSRLLNTFHIPLAGKISRGKTKIRINMSADCEGLITIVTECNGKKDTCDLSSDIYLSDEEFIETMQRVRSVQ